MYDYAELKWVSDQIQGDGKTWAKDVDGENGQSAPLWHRAT